MAFYLSGTKINGILALTYIFYGILKNNTGKTASYFWGTREHYILF